MQMVASSGAGIDLDKHLGIDNSRADYSSSEEMPATGQLDTAEDIPFRTFRLPNRGVRLYAFAIDLARFLGYKKSFPMFEKNSGLTKRFLSDDEKDYLIRVGLMANALRNQKVLAIRVEEIRKHIFFDEATRQALIARQQSREAAAALEEVDESHAYLQHDAAMRRRAPALDPFVTNQSSLLATAMAASQQIPSSHASFSLIPSALSSGVPSSNTMSASSATSGSSAAAGATASVSSINNLATYSAMAMAAAASVSTSNLLPAPVPYTLPRTNEWLYQAACNTSDFNSRLIEYRQHAPTYFDTNTRVRFTRQPRASLTKTLIHNHYDPCVITQYPMALMAGQRQDRVTLRKKERTETEEIVTESNESTPILDTKTPPMSRPLIDHDQDNESLHKRHKTALLDGMASDDESSSAVSSATTNPNGSVTNPLSEARVYYDIGFVSLGLPISEASASGSSLMSLPTQPVRMIQCGAVTSSGFPCEKLVSREGDRCTIHRPKKESSGSSSSGGGGSSRSKPSGHPCGFRQMTGPPCHRPVQKEGDYCSLHKDKQFFLCGFLTLSGKPCERVVYEQGLRCALHNRDALRQQDVDRSLCLVCRKKHRRVPRLSATEMEETLTCRACQGLFHPSCLSMSSRMKQRVKQETWQCADCRVCRCCQETGEEESLLFCDDCDRAYHTYCLRPKLVKLPEGRWICSDCSSCDCCHQAAKVALAMEENEEGNENEEKDEKDASTIKEEEDSDVDVEQQQKTGDDMDDGKQRLRRKRGDRSGRWTETSTMDSSKKRRKMEEENAETELIFAYADENNREGEPIFLTQLCASCSGHFDSGYYCPCCLKVYDGDKRRGWINEMVECERCERFVHRHCVDQGDEEEEDGEKHAQQHRGRKKRWEEEEDEEEEEEEDFEDDDEEEEDDEAFEEMLEDDDDEEEEKKTGRRGRRSRSEGGEAKRRGRSRGRRVAMENKRDTSVSRTRRQRAASQQRATVSEVVCLVCRAQEKQGDYDEEKGTVGEEELEASLEEPIKRKPGRPRKNAVAEATLSAREKRLLTLPMASFRGAHVALL